MLFSAGEWLYIVLVPHSNEGRGPDYLVVCLCFWFDKFLRFFLRALQSKSNHLSVSKRFFFGLTVVKLLFCAVCIICCLDLVLLIDAELVFRVRLCLE